MARDRGAKLLELLRANALPIGGGALGLIVAVLILLVGFWRMLLVALFVGGGVMAGFLLKNRTPLGEAISRLMPKEDEDSF